MHTPLGLVLFISIFPECSSIILFTIANPRPVPVFLDVTYGS